MKKHKKKPMAYEETIAMYDKIPMIVTILMGAVVVLIFLFSAIVYLCF